jgi:hypothetical protein
VAAARPTPDESDYRRCEVALHMYDYSVYLTNS